MRNLYSLVLFAAFFSLSQLSNAQNALNFDGSDDLVQTSFGGVTGSNNRTFEAWINVDAGLGVNKCITDYGLNAVGSRNTFSVSATYQLTFISGGVNANINSNANAVTPGQWTHVAFVLNSGTGYLYVDGVQVGTGSLTTVNTPTGNTDLRIGERVPGGTIPFQGSIDEVRIWNYARSVTEINNDKDSEFCSLPPGLVAYYKFNQGVAGGNNLGVTTLSDLSAGGNNGTLTNFSLSGSTSNWVSGASLNVSVPTATVNLTGCDSLVSPSGNYVWTTPGTYLDTVMSSAGCDSALTVILTFADATSASISETVCESFTSPSGNYTWTSSGTYLDTIPNAAGCDSVITIALTVNNTNSSLDVSACDSHTGPSGNYTWFTSGSYLDTIPNVAGCDSILTINLTIVGNTVNSAIEETACVSYTSPSGNSTWTSSGVYTDTLVSSVGCDSILTIDLSIISVDTTVQVVGNTLSSNAGPATYQWIRCNGNEPINGQTNKVFTPGQTGSYAVVVTQNGCTDTSSCFDVTIVGLRNALNNAGIAIYPNPSNGHVALDLRKLRGYSDVVVFNAMGQVVYARKSLAPELIAFELAVKGVYSVSVSNGSARSVLPLIIQ